MTNFPGRTTGFTSRRVSHDGAESSAPIFLGTMGWISTETSWPSAKPGSSSNSMTLPWITPLSACFMEPPAFLLLALAVAQKSLTTGLVQSIPLVKKPLHPLLLFLTIREDFARSDRHGGTLAAFFILHQCLLGGDV